MGGDHGPYINVRGAVLAVNKLPIHIILVGKKELIEKELASTNWPKDKISIIHASEVVTMSESPVKSFREKKDSSMQIGLKLVKENKAEAFVSAGNTGAILTTSLFILGRCPGVERPGLAATLPSKKHPFVMLDMGSCVDSKPSHLCQFAIMGHHFSSSVLGIKNPKVGLLNIGEEEDKGDMLTKATYPLLQKLPLNFIGNVEGREITLGKADVVVCDGFVGNNLLKFGEGISKLFTTFFKQESKTSWLSLLGLLLLKPAFKRFKKQFDYDEYGGAFILGVNGVSIVAHGSAKEKAIKNAIKQALIAIENKTVEKISRSISKSIEDQKTKI